MSFIEDIKSSKNLFRKIVDNKRLEKQEQAELDVIKEIYGILKTGRVRTQKALAELLDVNQRTIIRWKEDGMPVEPEGSYDPLKVLAWRWDVAGDELMGDDIRSEARKWDIEFRKNRALLAEIDLKKATDELIPRVDVEKLLIERALELKKSLLGRARRLAYQLADQPLRRCQDILERDALDTLTAYSRPNNIVKVNPGVDNG